MSGVNKVILVGRCGKDPEVRYLPNGDAVANLTLATSEEWKDKQTGEKVEKTEWHRVVLWRKLGEITGQYVKKGDMIYIEGALETRKWQDQSGGDRYTTEVNASKMQMLGGNSNQGQNNGYQGNQQAQQPAPQQQPQQAPQQGGYQQAPPHQPPQQPQQQQAPQGNFDDDVPF